MRWTWPSPGRPPPARREHRALDRLRNGRDFPGTCRLQFLMPTQMMNARFTFPTNPFHLAIPLETVETLLGP